MSHGHPTSNGTARSWTLRRVRTDDAVAIARHRFHSAEPKADIDAYSGWLPARIELGTYIGFIAEAEGRIVAGAGAVLLDWGPIRGEASGRRARIVNVFTDVTWRSQGIARALVGKVMATCADIGISVFSLAATPDGEQLYRSLGFESYSNEMILRRQPSDAS
jgi:GNAT superfamily N-acetyltransferase